MPHTSIDLQLSVEKPNSGDALPQTGRSLLWFWSEIEQISNCWKVRTTKFDEILKKKMKMGEQNWQNWELAELGTQSKRVSQKTSF